MNETQKDQKKTAHKAQLFMLLTAILLAMPSMIYDIQNKTILNYPASWTFLMENTLHLDATTRTDVIFNCVCVF